MKREKQKPIIRMISILVLSLFLANAFASSAYAVGTRNINLDSAPYTTSNPFYQSGWRGQCTWYAWGRAYQVSGINLPCRGHAGTWDETCGREVGTTPRANSVAVWEISSAGNDVGHVAYVEYVTDTEIGLSEANWGNQTVEYGYTEGKINRSTHKYTCTYNNVNNWTPYNRALPDHYIYLTTPTYKLDVNGMINDSATSNVTDYATFDMYINGSKVANDVSDYCDDVKSGSTYEIKDLKFASGKSFDGYSTYAKSGYTSKGRTGTVTSNTDVRLTLHTVNAATWTQKNKPASVNVWNNHTYYYYSAPASWYEAELVSEYNGGHLVTITSSSENDFVNSIIVNSYCWIGATDRDSEGTWKWVSGETFSYSNWRDGEPNNYQGDEAGENYGHIRENDTQWNDGPGRSSVPFVCEIDRAYTVSYNLNGGSGSISSQTKPVGYNITLSSTVPTRQGYEFLGWGTSSTATTATYHPGDAYKTDASTTLYAVWKNLDYTLSFDMNGGGGSIAPIHVQDGSPCTIPATVPTRTGYDFKGWAKSKTASKADYAAGDIYPGGTATLYAVWKIKTFTVSFDSDGAGNYDSITVEYGKTIGNLPTPEKSGVFFLGWFTSNGIKVSANTVVNTNLALTARWSEPSRMVLPDTLSTIEDEAFMGTAPNVVIIPDTIAIIGPRAFADNENLYSVVIHKRSVTIANDAFENCPNVTVYGYAGSSIEYYCTSKGVPFRALDQDDFIPSSELPVGANVTSEKWTYTQSSTETTTSPETSLAGWTQTGEFTWETTGTGTHKYASYPSGFDTGNSLYSKYNKSALSSSTSGNTKREVSKSSFLTYIYWHWTFVDSVSADHATGGHNVFIRDARMLNEIVSGTVKRDFIYFDAFESTEDQGTVGPRDATSTYDIGQEGGYYYWRNNNADASQWWWRFNVYQQTYTDSRKRFTYQRTVTENKESSSPVVEGNGISNVRHLVKYEF